MVSFCFQALNKIQQHMNQDTRVFVLIVVFNGFWEQSTLTMNFFLLYALSTFVLYIIFNIVSWNLAFPLIIIIFINNLLVDFSFRHFFQLFFF